LLGSFEELLEIFQLQIHFTADERIAAELPDSLSKSPLRNAR
jgi:hypothetical protein